MVKPGDPRAHSGADPTIDEILEVMARAGLPIGEEDADRLQRSFRRTRAMAAEVRQLVRQDVEPSGPGMVVTGEPA